MPSGSTSVELKDDATSPLATSRPNLSVNVVRPFCRLTTCFFLTTAGLSSTLRLPVAPSFGLGPKCPLGPSAFIVINLSLYDNAHRSSSTHDNIHSSFNFKGI